MMSATRAARLYEIVMDAGRIGASKIIISPVKLLPRTWAGMPKMSFRKSRDSYTPLKPPMNQCQLWRMEYPLYLAVSC